MAENSKYWPLDAKVSRVEPMIRLSKVTHTDPSVSSRTWESAEGQTRPKATEIDGVGVVAVLNHPAAGPLLLLQKQFHPPLNKVMIEVPSGLIDEGETPAQSALRELKEKTGCIATIPGDAKATKGFIMWNDPGFCNTNTKIVFVEVDMSDPRNQEGKLKPKLKENEYIESFSISLASLLDDLATLDKESVMIDDHVGTLAQGMEMEMARKWKDVLTTEENLPLIQMTDQKSCGLG